MLADSHCHLDFFTNPRDVVKRANNAGVKTILSNSTNLPSLYKNLALSEDFDSVKCALGLHPVDLPSMSKKDISSSLDFIKKNISSAVAVGEIGMDYKYGKEQKQRSLQESIFRDLVLLSLENDLPVVVHARYCEPKCLDILEEMGVKNVHMHWFTNSKENAMRAVSLGYYVSCGPVIFSDDLTCDIVRSIPLENLLLETDAPVKFSGQISEPFWITKVCEKVAYLKGKTFLQVEKETWENFSNLFLENL